MQGTGQAQVTGQPEGAGQAQVTGQPEGTGNPTGAQPTGEVVEGDLQGDGRPQGEPRNQAGDTLVPPEGAAGGRELRRR